MHAGHPVGHVQTSFMDRTFGGNNWKQTLQDSLDASFKAKNESEAMDVIDSMLKKRGECQTTFKASPIMA